MAREPKQSLTPDVGEIKYFVLVDRAMPFLLARVRWPDVAQALSAASPEWLEDMGLFDLPYDPNAVGVSFDQAAALVSAWGRVLHAEPDESAAAYIRRMPANWSDLTPSERRAWGIEFIGRPRSRALAVHGLQSRFKRRLAGEPALGDESRGLETAPDELTVAERRGPQRIRLDGRAYIRFERVTLSAALIDMSDSGLRCSLPEASRAVAPGVTLGGPYLIEAEAAGSRICLDVMGQVSWDRDTDDGTQFGLAFGELASGEIEGVQHLLADVRARGTRT
jgi:hypothetical protein